MIILAIETSCDETSVAIIKKSTGKHLGFTVLAHEILSQVDIHKEYGGVFPALAKREHARTLTQLIAKALQNAKLLQEKEHPVALKEKVASHVNGLLSREEEMRKSLLFLFENIKKPRIDAVAVTAGPGLEPALWVGVNAASAIGYVWNIPVYPVNHMEGHIIASLLQEEKKKYVLHEMRYPALSLLVSGGHTEIVRMPKLLSYHIVGRTRDDAVGECFDKTARMLGLPYPGGPEISKLALDARKRGYLGEKKHVLPRPMIHSGDLDFSFSGLKTAALTKVKEYGEMSDAIKAALSYEIETAIVDVLIGKMKKAIYEMRAQSIIIGGGVSANTHLREQMRELALVENVDLYIPERHLSTDNALMIAAVGLLHVVHKKQPLMSPSVYGNWRIDEPFPTTHEALIESKEKAKAVQKDIRRKKKGGVKKKTKTRK